MVQGWCASLWSLIFQLKYVTKSLQAYFSHNFVELKYVYFFQKISKQHFDKLIIDVRPFLKCNISLNN
jgi:hypothetical protein